MTGTAGRFFSSLSAADALASGGRRRRLRPTAWRDGEPQEHERRQERRRSEDRDGDRDDRPDEAAVGRDHAQARSTLDQVQADKGIADPEGGERGQDGTGTTPRRDPQGADQP